MARHRNVAPRQLTAAERRALAAFLAGRLPAGQLDAELARARAAPPQSALRAA